MQMQFCIQSYSTVDYPKLPEPLPGDTTIENTTPN